MSPAGGCDAGSPGDNLTERVHILLSEAELFYLPKRIYYSILTRDTSMCEYVAVVGII